MADREDTQPPDPMTGDPEAAGTSSENDAPGGRDAAVSATPGPAGALDDSEEHLPDPFFWPEEQADAPEGAAAAAPAERDEAGAQEEIDEIMARAMRWRAVEANKIITHPADIQSYVEKCWTEELPAARAAHSALEAAGYVIVRKTR